nr:catalase [Protofrankia symbiont of Coriaria ruscifolia]
MTRPVMSPDPESGKNDISNPLDNPLDAVRVSSAGAPLTTNQGVRVDDTDNSLTVGERGPSLLEDFHLREKITHFDHERIPERVVHARGFGAHGYFEPTVSMADYTVADFLAEPGRRTPVFVRFSTVVGSRGSADTVRDVRGFAVKFYTREGNFDLVGNNMPVFFIQDGIKFPDFVHAVKPEPHNEVPQASTAHDTLWDFVSLTPESMHMMMWALSDRAIPRSYRMMQGFGVHTFRLVGPQGRSHFVKFHWKPVLGTHSLVWDEAQKLAGKDPDFNRRDLWEAIEAGHPAEYELGVQLVPEQDASAFDFDLLDPTKIIPEETVPVRTIGKLTLNRNTDNFFAETEQVAFHIGNLVRGIDVTDDPLLQARMFSYLDTQLIRLGGPNFHELPVNRSHVEIHNNQRDGYGRQRIDTGRASYHPSSLDGGGATPAGADNGGYQHHPEHLVGNKIRKRPDSFADHYSQATLFWNSMSEPERQHIVDAAVFELGKVATTEIRERMVEHFNHVDHEFAVRVAEGLGTPSPAGPVRANHGRGSPALSQDNTAKDSVRTRRVAVLAADGLDGETLTTVKAGLTDAGASVDVVAAHGGTVATDAGGQASVDRIASTVASVMYDAVLVPGGEPAVQELLGEGDAIHFVNEAFKHGKALAAVGAGVELFRRAQLSPVRLAADGEGLVVDAGVVTTGQGASVSSGGDGRDQFLAAFVAAVAAHRHWQRANVPVPA